MRCGCSMLSSCSIKLAKTVWKISAAGIKVYGGAPFPRYIYHFRTRRGGGYMAGLEHLNSTVLGAKRTGYAHEETYKDFLSLVAHEYFHLWNVKRLRPKALGPFNYDQENYTSDLWISEGFTAYYDNMILRRSGFTRRRGICRCSAAILGPLRISRVTKFRP